MLNCDTLSAQFLHPTSSFTNQCTYFMYYDRPSVSGSPSSFLLGNVEAAGVGYNAGLYDNTGNYLFYVKNASGTPVSATSTTASNVIGVTANIKLCGTYDGAEVGIWFDGRREAVSGQTGNIGTTSFGLNVNRWNSGSGHHIELHVAYVWNRCLTQQEIKSLSANPWQLFAHKGLVGAWDAVAAGGSVELPALTMPPMTLGGWGRR